MRHLHGFLTGLAAVIVIVIGGLLSAQLWISWRQMQEWKTENSENEGTLVAKSGVPVSGSGELRAFNEAYGEKLLSYSETAEAVIVPVFFGKQGSSLDHLELSADTESKTLHFFGSCEGTPIANAAYVHTRTGNFELMLDRRAFVAGVGAARFTIGDVAVILAVEKDTNGDNYLNCEDEARLEIFRPNGAGLTRTDILFDANATSFRKPDDKTIVAALDTRDADGGKIAKIFEFNVEAGSHIELSPPDIATKAIEVFERLPE